MKFRLQLFLTSIIVTFILCLFIAVSEIFIFKNNLKTNLLFTDSILEHFTINSTILSDKELTSYTEKYLKSQTINKGYKIKDIVDFSHTSPEQLEGNSQLWELLAVPLKVNNTNVGYFALLNGANEVIIAPEGLKNKANNLKNFDEFPKLKVLREKAVETGKASGYIKFYDVQGKKIIPKYAVIIRLYANYFIAGLINVGCYHQAADNNLYVIKEKYLQLEKTKLLKYYGNNYIKYIVVFLLAIFILMLVYLVIINWIVKSVTKPLNTLIRKVKIFNPQKPDFSLELPANTSQEIIDLYDAFSAQEHELITYMNNFKIELENRHIIEHELKVARKIQSSVLPKTSTDFCPKSFSLAAKLISAETVAGDFYDYFYLDDENIAVIIADVSGKGIPAAFFMQRTTTILHSFSIAEKDKGPAVALERANSILSENNDACMFVTVFLGFYNLKTNIFTYSSAGHYSPYRIIEGKISKLDYLQDPALGIMPHIIFKSKSTKIEINETLVLFTNGVIDNLIPKNDKTNEEILIEMIIKNEKLSVHDLNDEIVKNIKIVHSGQIQDDITLIIFRRNI